MHCIIFSKIYECVSQPKWHALIIVFVFLGGANLLRQFPKLLEKIKLHLGFAFKTIFFCKI